MIAALRKLALSLTVIFGALAPVASAANFHSEVLETEIRAQQLTQVVFASSNFHIICNNVYLAGAQVGSKSGPSDYTVASVELHPTAETCKEGGYPFVFETAGCNLKFSAAAKTAGSMSIVCSPGKEIVATYSTGCKVKFPPQTPKNPSVDYETKETGVSRTIATTFTVGQTAAGAGLKYSTTGGACGTSGEDGTLRGSTASRGYDPHGAQVGIWVE